MAIGELESAGKNCIKSFSTYVRYCSRVVEAVESMGAWAIFIPEVLPPNIYKTVNDACLNLATI